MRNYPGFFILLFALKTNPEGGAFSQLAFYLNLASVIFYDPLNHIQANTAAFYMIVKTLKHRNKFFIW